MILTNKPITKTTVLHHSILCPLHAVTLPVGDIKLLVQDEKLRADVMTRVDPLLRKRANTSGNVPKNLNVF